MSGLNLSIGAPNTPSSPVGLLNEGPNLSPREERIRNAVSFLRENLSVEHELRINSEDPAVGGGCECARECV